MADPVASLLQTLGGTKTTMNAGDTTALSGILAQLQGQDFNALLQQIFQAAGGQIPGLQAAYGNAVGARRGGNSAIQNALNALLTQTTLAGQKQISDAQAQNLQTQANVGGNIAQTTRGTTQQMGTNLGSAAKNLAILQGLAKLADTDIGKKLIGFSKGSVTGTNDQPVMGGAQGITAAPAIAGITQSAGGLGLQAPVGTFNLFEALAAPSTTDFLADYSLNFPMLDTEPGLQITADNPAAYNIGSFDYNLVADAGGGTGLDMGDVPDDWLTNLFAQ